MANKTTLAAAQHAMGLREEAAAHFEEAERMQKERQPAYPLLYALQGSQYCDLLLDQGRDAEVRERAESFFAWRVPSDSLLDIALDHLSLGRAHLVAAQHGAANALAQATSHLQQAVDGFRRAGHKDDLSLGLLSRAALRIHTHDFAAARHDLDETLTLATRCGFRLHEADAHLGLARLALAENTPAPAREHLATARRIVHETGYHRRDGELTALDAEAAAMPEPKPPPAQGPALPLAPTPTPTLDFAPTPPALTTVKNMPLLDPAVIRELHAAAVSSGLVRSRDALLSGVDNRVVAGLPAAANPAAQLLVDLHELNTIGALADATVPLHTWLANAAHLAGLQREAALFEHHRDRLAPAPEPRIAEALPRNPR
jgi:hypothetical protein